MRDFSEKKLWSIRLNDLDAKDYGKVREALATKLSLSEIWTGAMFPPDIDVLLVGARKMEQSRYGEYFHEGDLPEPHLPDTLSEIAHRNHAHHKPFVPNLRRSEYPFFPVNWLYPAHIVNLWGRRGSVAESTTVTEGIKGLLPADLLWAFFHERMGLFRMLGALLDDFCSKGVYAIQVGSDEAGWPAVVLESLVRAKLSGVGSRAQDRAATYLRVLGWVNRVGVPEQGVGGSVRRLDPEQPKGVVANTPFSKHFHRLLRTALEYHRQRRFLESTVGAKQLPSSGTLASVRTEIAEVRRAMLPFEWGRCQNDTLAAVATIVGAYALLERLRQTLGVPDAFQTPQAYIPMLYDRLLGEGPLPSSKANPFNENLRCADAGRRILLDVPFLDTDNDGLVRTWLDNTENTFEDYRGAYQSLTGRDVGSDDARPFEQELGEAHVPLPSRDGARALPIPS